MALRHHSSGWCLRSISATLDTMRDAPRGTPSVDVLDTYGVLGKVQGTTTHRLRAIRKYVVAGNWVRGM